jgi:hypothetical protein
MKIYHYQRLRIFAISILTLLFVCSCTERIENNDKTNLDNLQSKLVQFEKKFNEKNKVLKYTLNEVKSFKNPYDSSGEKLLKNVKSLSDFISNQRRNSRSTFEGEVKPFVDKQVLTLKNVDLKFNKEEEALYNSFLRKFQFNNAIFIVKLYEDFVFKNYNNPSDVKRFLIVISNIKFTAYSISVNKTAQWEGCADDCMRDNYAGYNAVDWLQFSINPGADVLWTYASCVWDCT